MIDVKKIREDFPILKRRVGGKPLVYLDNAATTQKPRQVIKAITNYYEQHNANVHRGIHRLSEEATNMVEEAREKVASFIGTKLKEEVVFVRNTSEALNLLIYSWGRHNIKKGDAVVVSYLEHHSNFVGWQQLVKEKEAELRVLEVDEDGQILINEQTGKKKKRKKTDGWLRTGSLRELLDEKVKVVAIAQVSNVLGTIAPVGEISKIVRKQAPEAVLVVDGAQSVPHMPVKVNDLGADFLAFSGHKMLGPTGIGVLWGRKRLLEEMPPFMYGGDMISEVTINKSTWNQLPWKFEAGTPDMAGMVGLGAAIDYLERIGMEEIREHEKTLAAYALFKMQKLEEEGLIELYGIRDVSRRGGVITFNVKGVHAHDVAQVLDSEGVAVRSGHHCAMPLAKRLGISTTVRASFYLYNLQDEVDKMVRAIGKVKKVFRI